MAINRTAWVWGVLAIIPAVLNAWSAPLDLSAYRGRVVYLDFWASWCGPCRQSFPWMQTLQDTYATRGLTVIAVDVDRERHDADKFLSLFRPTFDVRFDPDGELPLKFNVKGMPTSLIIDRHGTVRFTHIGFRPVDQVDFEAQIREVLDEP